MDFSAIRSELNCLNVFTMGCNEMTEWKREKLFNLMEEIFCANGNKDFILGEIGLIRHCILCEIPYNKNDFDIGGWTKRFLAGEDKITFCDNKDELNDLIITLRGKADEEQKKIDVLKDELKTLLEFPSMIKVMDFIERMNGHMKNMFGKCNSRIVENKRSEFETAGILQFGWKCFIEEDEKRLVFKNTAVNWMNKSEDDLFLKIDMDDGCCANESFLDEKSGMLVNVNDASDDSGFEENAVFTRLDETSGQIISVGNEDEDEDEEANGYLDEKTGEVRCEMILDDISGVLIKRTSRDVSEKLPSLMDMLVETPIGFSDALFSLEDDE